MTHEIEFPLAPESVPLQNAVLCVDCELITSSISDKCPICGGHSLLGIASIIGGTLVEYHESRIQQLLLFNLDVSINMTEMEAGELSTAIEGLSRVVAPKLGRNRASLHVNVEPVSRSAPVILKAA